MPTQSGSLSSSWIAGYEYDPDTQELVVNLLNGSSYSHDGISQEEVADFINAPSKGQWYNANLK
jgi:hypothetical protein